MAKDLTKKKRKVHFEPDNTDIIVEVDLGMGEAESTVFTTDMSSEYIKINAEYTT